jgi:signal transduction histidine kinase
LLAAAAERCLMAAEKARLMEDLAAREEQIRQLAEHMLHVEEIERRRISRELHDEAGQSLLCIRLQIELLEQAIPAEHAEWIGKLRRRGTSPSAPFSKCAADRRLEPGGAGTARFGSRPAATGEPLPAPASHPRQAAAGPLGRLPQHTEIIVYRLVQECCNNIAKHSAASSVNISVSSADGWVRLAVEDNGVGFRVEEALARKDSFGLSGMRERVALLGGRFEIRSYPKNGSGVRQREPGIGKSSVDRKKTGRGTKI